MSGSPACRERLSRIGGMLAVTLLALGSALGPASLAFERHTAHGGPVKGLALSPDGRWMVSTSFDYSAVFWSADALTERRRLIGHEAAVNAAAFSPDGRFLVTAGDDATLLVWHVAQLLEDAVEPKPTVLRGHTAKVVHLAFSPDGRMLASSSWDNTIGLWSVPAFEQRAFLVGHEGPVQVARFSRDGSSLYSAGGDGHVRLWDVREARHVRSVVENGWGINVLAVDEDLDLLAYGSSNGALRLRSVGGHGTTVDLLPEGPPVLSLSLDPKTGRLACGNAEGRLLVVDAHSRAIEHDFRATNGPVWTLLLMPEGKSVVFAGLDDFITRLPLENAGPEFAAAGSEERRFHPQGPLDNGARQFARKCSVCHSLGADDRRRAGPSLHGIFGRKAGALADYPYSPALSRVDLVWNDQTIDALFREGPDIVTPGSKMPLQRIRNKRDRRDLIDFLKSNTTH